MAGKETCVTFSPRKTKSKEFCSVYGYSTKAKYDVTVRFHRFPKKNDKSILKASKLGSIGKIDRQKAWKINLKVGKKVTPNMLVCSRHFKPDDYFMPDFGAHRRRLKNIAVPSLQLPKISYDLTVPLENQKKNMPKKRESKKERKGNLKRLKNK